MKIKNLSGLAKGISLAAAGIILAFFPEIISGVFHVVGGLIIAVSAVSLVSSLISYGKGNGISAGSFMGIMIGILVVLLPNLTEVIITLIIGIILAATGIDFIIKARKAGISKTTRTVYCIAAAILIILALALIFQIINAGKAVRVIAGIIMAVIGFYNIFAEKIERDNYIPDVIDVDNYSIHDDNKYIK